MLLAWAITACLLGETLAAEEDPLAVLDAPAVDADSDDSTDPLSVLDEPSASPDDAPGRDAVSGGAHPEASRAAGGDPSQRQPPEVTTVEVARDYFESGDFAKAELLAKVLLREFNKDIEALRLRVDLALARYDGAGAELILRRLLAADVPLESLALKLAEALNLQGKHRQGHELLSSIETGMPAERARLLAERARARVGLGDVAGAQRLLDEATALAADVAAPHIGRAVLALRNGFPRQARDLVDRALVLEPNNGDAWLFLGQIERALANPIAAEVAFGEVIERAPSKWMAAYWRAITRTELGDLQGAEQDIALAEAQFPGFVGLAYARARLALAAGHPRDAARHLGYYLGTLPTDRDALFYAALAANQLRNREQALGYLDRLYGVEGDSVRQLWLRAQTLMAAGEHGSAARLLGPSAGPDGPLALILAREQALRRLGRNDEALALIRQARSVRDARALEVAEAKLWFVTGDIDAAERIALGLLRRDPDDLDALLITSEIALRRDTSSPATARRLAAAATDAPGDIRVPTLRAQILAAHGAKREACAALVEALRIDPTATGVLARLRALRCAAVDPELVQQAFSTLIESDTDAARTLPHLLALNGDGADAEAMVRRLRVALAAAPENIQLRSGLVDALLRLRRVDAAQSVVDAVPDGQRRHPLLLRALGVVALVRGEQRAALTAFKDLAAAWPESAEAAYLLTEAQVRTADHDAARHHLLEAWRLDAEHPLAPLVLSRVFALESDAGVRRRLIDALQRAAPDSPLIEPLQAQTLLDAGRPEQAAELYAAMYARDPDNPRLLLNLVRTMAAAGVLEPINELAEPWMKTHGPHADLALVLADVNAELGRREQAIRWYRQVLALAPDNLYALNDLAVLLTDSDPTTALALAERAHRQAPTSPQVADTYGVALLAVGETARARAILTEAFAHPAAGPMVGLNLARALAADGNPLAAQRVLEPLLEKPFPRQAEARDLMRRLSNRGD